MKKISRWMIILGIVAILAITCVVYSQHITPTPHVNTQPRIGAIIPLSGDLANFGIEIQKGISLYEQENKCDFIIEDDNGNSKDGINAFRKLRNIDNTSLIIGPFGPITSQALYESQSTEDKKVIMIAISMCSQEFSSYKNMLCSYPSPEYQLEQSFTFPKNKNLTTFNMLLSNDAQGELIGNIIEDISVKNNLIITNTYSINTQDIEFRTIVTKTVHEKTNFMFISTGNIKTNIELVKELKELQYNGTIIVGSDIEEKYVKDFSSTLEGVYFSGIADISYQEEFVSNYASTYNSTPNLYSAYGYMLSKVLCESTPNKNDELQTQDIINYVNTHSQDLPVKNMHYDNRTITLPMKILRIENGTIRDEFVSE